MTSSRCREQNLRAVVPRGAADAGSGSAVISSVIRKANGGMHGLAGPVVVARGPALAAVQADQAVDQLQAAPRLISGGRAASNRTAGVTVVNCNPQAAALGAQPNADQAGPVHDGVSHQLADDEPRRASYARLAPSSPGPRG